MKTPLSSLALLFIAVFLLASTFYFQRWKSGGILAGGDSWEYYVYNPALFIHHDLDNLHTSITHRSLEGGTYEDTTRNYQGPEYSYPGDGTKVVIKAPCGIAILQAPFFGIAHVLAKISGARANGLSPIYLILAHLSTTIYVMLGLFFLRRVLLLYFSDTVTALTLIAVSVATNLLYFCVETSPMAHPYLFGLCCLIIYGTVFFYKTAAWRYALLIGFAAGLTSICRPNDILFLLIPLLFGLTSLAAITQRFSFLQQNFLKILASIAAFSLAVLPQMVYWKYTSGHWVYYSYGNESFDFGHPHLYRGLFGFQNGFFPYAPVMLLAVAGMLPLLFKKSPFKILIPFFFTVHAYIIYSWWCWNYVNGLGSRPMVEVYPLLAIPMATTLNCMLKARIGKWIVAPMLLLFIVHQFIMSYQCSINLLWSEDSNRTFYWHTLFKTKTELSDLVVYDLGEVQPAEATLKHSIYLNALTDSISPFSQKSQDGQYVLKLKEKGQAYTFIDSTLGSCKLSNGDWLKVSFDAYNLRSNTNLYDCTNIVIQLKRGENATSYKTLRIQNKIPNKPPYGVWHFESPAKGKVSFYSQIPYGSLQTDKLKVFVMNDGNGELLIKNMQLDACSGF